MAEFEFGHILIRDVAYGQILRADRADKHARAAKWLESSSAARGGGQTDATRDENSELIAHHYERALTFTRAIGQHDVDLVRRTARAVYRAGDRAEALGVQATAARYYTRALELYEDGSPELPELKFRAGKAIYRSAGGGDDLLVGARDAFLQAGERERAAESEILISQSGFMRGDGDRGAHIERALSLVAEAPPSPSKAVVLQVCAAHFNASDQYPEAINVGRDALQMARALALRETEAQALGIIGFAKVFSGDGDGVAALERCTETLDELGSYDSGRWYTNLACALETLGDLPGGSAARSAAENRAERFESERTLRWVRCSRVSEHYWRGRWDAAIQAVDGFVEEWSHGRSHYLLSVCRAWRGRIRLARGAVDAALEDAAAALDLARAVGDPQNLAPALAFHTWALLAAGRADEARVLIEELLPGLAGKVLKEDLGVDLPASLVALGYPAAVLDRGIPSTPWLDAAKAFVAGHPRRAAEIYARIGSRPDEAHARLAAARRLAGDGRSDEARVELDAAVAFYREVGASAYLRDATRLRDVICPV